MNNKKLVKLVILLAMLLREVDNMPQLLDQDTLDIAYLLIERLHHKTPSVKVTRNELPF